MVVDNTPTPVSSTPRKRRQTSSLVLEHLHGIPALVEATGLSASFIRKLIKNGQGPAHVRIGSRTLFTESAISAWLDERRSA